MARRVSAPGPARLRENDESAGDSEKSSSWLVCNANGCYRLGSGGSRSRRRSINPPPPVLLFGRKGHLWEDEKKRSSHVDPSEHFLAWAKPPQNVLVIKKLMDQEVTESFKELTRWLTEERKMVIYAEESAVRDLLVRKDEKFTCVRSKMCIFKEGDQLDDKIDFVICMGGDGTLLHASSLFQVLNEVVVDRGPSSYLTNLEIYCNDHHITSVQGDGLIVSTPTGSTAYAVAAGASMVHPSVAGILVTPVCPHSLSFRPIILPAGVELKIVVSSESRSSAWTSFDGRQRQELHVGDSIQITTSIYPVPCVNSENQIADWFVSLAECLHWNVRQRQRNLSITDCHV